MASNPFNQLLIAYLTTPSSDFYLSKLILGSTNPTLEPFKASKVDLGNQNILGTEIAITLTNLDVVGISNVQVEKKDAKPVITISGNDVTFIAQTPNTEAPPKNIPKEITLTSDLNLISNGVPPIVGTITIQIKTSTITGSFVATSSDGTPQTVNVDFTKLGLSATSDNQNIAININVNSPLSSFINSVFSQAIIQQKIITAIGSQINQPPVLQAISKYSTEAARKALGNM